MNALMLESVLTCPQCGFSAQETMPTDSGTARMLRLTGLIGIAAAMLPVASGCTWQQAYSAGQAWQRNACNRLAEQTERERCLSNADMTYDDYRRRIEPKKD